MSFSAAVFAQQQWPATLERDVKLQSWDAAARVGQASVEEIEAGRMFAHFGQWPEEAKLRGLYADALEHLGRFDEARRQRCIADQQPACAAQVAQEKKRRLLASEIQQPAPPFRLKNLDGTEISLDRYRGQAVILAISASWCAPCATELEALNRYRHPRATSLSLSLDRPVQRYTFPVLLADSATQRAYAPLTSLESAQVPQLYVIDPTGHIRFHLAGFLDDVWFSHELDWMVEAVLQ